MWRSLWSGGDTHTSSIWLCSSPEQCNHLIMWRFCYAVSKIRLPSYVETIRRSKFTRCANPNRPRIPKFALQGMHGWCPSIKLPADNDSHHFFLSTLEHSEAALSHNRTKRASGLKCTRCNNTRSVFGFRQSPVQRTMSCFRTPCLKYYYELFEIKFYAYACNATYV